MPTPMGPIDPSKVFNYEKKDLFDRTVFQKFVPEQNINNEKELTRVLMENDNDVGSHPQNFDSGFYSRFYSISLSVRLLWSDDSRTPASEVHSEFRYGLIGLMGTL